MDKLFHPLSGTIYEGIICEEVGVSSYFIPVNQSVNNSISQFGDEFDSDDEELER